MSDSPSLILVAHGAIDSPRSNQPLVELAESVAANGPFDWVSPAFLNGDPLVTFVLSLAPTSEVIIVPVMTSQGYYLKKLPVLFEENDHFDQFHLQTTGVAGMHPGISSAMACRAQQHVDRLAKDGRPVAVIVIGHGTRRNATSGASTHQLVEDIHDHLDTTISDDVTFSVSAAFLDQDPELEAVIETIPSDHHLVALPFLVGLGPHMTEDVAEALHLPVGEDAVFPVEQNHKGRTIFCDQPIAQYEEMTSIVLDLANSVQFEEARV